MTKRREEQDAKAMHRIECIDKAIDYIPAIKDVVNKFHMKVYNVKFEDALRQVSNVNPTIYTPQAGYTKNREIVIFFDYNNQFHVTPITQLLWNKRINAETMCNSIDEHVELLLKEKEVLQTGLNCRVDEVIRKMEEIKTEWRALRDSTPSIIRDIWELDFTITY